MAEYIVSKGDNLSSISKKIYGNSNKYMDIARRNGITDVNSLKIGQKLIIKLLLIKIIFLIIKDNILFQKEIL